MPHFICRTCGTEHAASERPPDRCAICDEERQYVPETGQAWTTIEALRLSHRIAFRQYEADLIGVGMEPAFAIAQRALLVRHPEGNILWDCVSLVDDAAVTLLKALGGIRAIAVSHPHYYTSVVEWSRAFDNAPVYLHAADRQWCMRPDPIIRHWEEDRMELADGVTLFRAGGHFAGATFLHWSHGSGGAGALLTGDTIQVAADRKSASFMYSYPNYIPLPAVDVECIADLVGPLRFERVYGAWWDRFIDHNAKAIVLDSARRYVRAVGKAK
jgi:hypothetical protein